MCYTYYIRVVYDVLESDAIEIHYLPKVEKEEETDTLLIPLLLLVCYT